MYLHGNRSDELTTPTVPTYFVGHPHLPPRMAIREARPVVVQTPTSQRADNPASPTAAPCLCPIPSGRAVRRSGHRVGGAAAAATTLASGWARVSRGRRCQRGCTSQNNVVSRMAFPAATGSTASVSQPDRETARCPGQGTESAHEDATASQGVTTVKCATIGSQSATQCPAASLLHPDRPQRAHPPLPPPAASAHAVVVRRRWRR